MSDEKKPAKKINYPDRGPMYPLDHPAQIMLVEDMSRNGFTKKMMAKRLGVSERTLDRRMNENPKLRDAYIQGRMETFKGIVETGINMAKSGKFEGMTKHMMGYFGHMLENENDSQDGQEEGKQLRDVSQREMLIDALKKDKFIDINVDNPESDEE